MAGGGEETLPGPEGRHKGSRAQCEGSLLDCWRREEKSPGEEGGAERKEAGESGGEVRTSEVIGDRKSIKFFK